MRYYILGLLIIIAVSCCHDDFEGYETNKDLPRLRNEWEREYEAWKKLDIQNYRFTHILFPEEVREGLIITVKKGQLYEVIDLETGYPIEREVSISWGAKTIDDVFLRINEYFDLDEKKIDVSKNQIGSSFKAKYDPDYHFPAYYSVTNIYKYKHKYHNLIGHEKDFAIDDFTIIDE